MSVVTRIGGVEQGGLNDEAAREQALMRRQQYTVVAANAGLIGAPTIYVTTGTLSGATSGGTARLPTTRSTSAASVGALALIRTGIVSPFSWRSRMYAHVRFLAAHAPQAGARTFVGFTNNGTIDADTKPTYQMFTLRASGNAGDTTWKIVTSDGSNATVTDTGVTLTGNMFEATFDYTVSGRLVVKLWELVSEVWVYRGSWTVTATLPAMTLAGDTTCACGVFVESLDGTARSIDLSRISIFAGSFNT